MKNRWQWLFGLMLSTTFFIASEPAIGATAAELTKEAESALQALYAKVPSAKASAPVRKPSSSSPKSPRRDWASAANTAKARC